MDPAFVVGIVALSLTGAVFCATLANVLFNLSRQKTAFSNDSRTKERLTLEEP